MWKDSLKMIEKQMAEYGFKMQPPVSQKNIEELLKKSQRNLKVDLPESYIEFLKVRNGLSWNGLFIYGSKTLPIPETEDQILGFVEANEIWRDREGHKKLLIFGDGNISLYYYNLETGEYGEVDRSSDTNIQIFMDFSHMLDEALQSSLM